MGTTIMRLSPIFALAFVAACSDSTSPPTSAHGVMIALQVPGPCLLACDPVPNPTTTPGLVTLRNTASTTAYLEHCGSAASLSEQVFVNGQWLDVPTGVAVTCAQSGPVTIAPGDSLRLNWFFQTGRRRLLLRVSTDATLSDVAIATSSSVVVK
jgi:hypothetical protein